MCVFFCVCLCVCLTIIFYQQQAMKRISSPNIFCVCVHVFLIIKILFAIDCISVKFSIIERETFLNKNVDLF